MTDRLKGFVVTFAEDIREDDAEALLGLLRLSSWVASVDPLVRQPDDFVVENRLKMRLGDKLLDFVKEELR